VSSKKPLLVVVAGPTASGKTAVAIALAKCYQTSILSADSRQCFREMSIGVAKPTEFELAQVPHFFINTHSIHEAADAAMFESYGMDVLKGIFANNDIAIAAGGTGLYIKALCEGMDNMPDINPEIRNRVRLLYEKEGITAISDALKEYDPLYAQTGETQNPQRVMRALEVAIQTGNSIRTYQQGKKHERFFNTLYIGMDVAKEILHQRINQRVDSMMEAGLLDEVKKLLPYRQLNALQTVGYKELFDYFDKKLSLDMAVDQIKTHTRQYAKRQMTWFKRVKNMNWFFPSDVPGIMQCIEAYRANN
jgi:tRNA dimethylallyltransferase